MNDDPLVRDLRARIEAADRALIAALNERLELVAALKRHKEERGIEFVDPERERLLVELLHDSNRGPLSPGGLRELYAEILALTKRELDR
jgi:chorismate mutase